MPFTQLRVPSAGLTLSARRYAAAGDAPSAPHVVLVHGYPDNQAMWEPVAERLAAAGLHVVTYDVRGAGGSGVPARTEDYRVELLVEDLATVVRATVPAAEPVHLVGHDWGSVQLWEAVLSAEEEPRLKGRIASFTAASGPSLEHLAYLARRPAGRRVGLLRQAGHSWYVYFFQLPWVPELLWRGAHRPFAALAGRGAGPRRWGPELAEDGARGVNLYRANVLRGLARPQPRRTTVPVRVVLPRRDPFVTAVTLEDLDALCEQVDVVRPDSGHWLPRSDPHLMARLIREHVEAHA